MCWSRIVSTLEKPTLFAAASTSPSALFFDLYKAWNESSDNRQFDYYSDSPMTIIGNRNCSSMRLNNCFTDTQT